MRIRRAIGNRRPPAPWTPPQSIWGVRRTAYACFACRISVKQNWDAERRVCGRCAGELHSMGWSFHAPPASDREQWRKVQTLFAEGFRFFGSGREGGEPLPARLRDVDAFLARNPEHHLRIAERRPELLP